jgi:hypothetical protein
MLLRCQERNKNGTVNFGSKGSSICGGVISTLQFLKPETWLEHRETPRCGADTDILSEFG